MLVKQQPCNFEMHKNIRQYTTEICLGDKMPVQTLKEPTFKAACIIWA